ncbi:helix-turn-helix transcriptional regulator [Pseudovibrio sp. SCP19]|uniref:helix-turn-helix transcriptional regulator n=1 Tax=Pseudovibrio sp. SCP19 TaxID=3141374 RepID=UPI00333D9784
MQGVHDEMVRKLYANIALGEDIGEAFEPIASSFRETIFCYKIVSLNSFDYRYLSFLNSDEDMEDDMLAAGISNPLPKIAKFTPMHSVVHTEDFISPDAIRDTDFYDRVFKKYGRFDRVRGFMIHRQGVEAAVASIAVQSDFGGSEAELLEKALEAIRPHFQSAFSVALHLEQRRGLTDAYTFWLDRIPSAAFILDQGMHVAFANKQAEVFFGSNESFFIDRRGEVSSRHNGHRKLFEDAVTKCRVTSKPLGPLVLEGEAAPNPFFVVMPIDVLAETPAYLAPFVRGLQPLLCMIMDPGDRPLAELENLQHYFGISKREAELLQHLVQGASMGETSHALDISYNTARNHMARIADKVSVNSQSELVRLASDLAARVPR